MFNNLDSPLEFLRTRRSGKPRYMVAPGPDDAQMQQILTMASRTPDHGKLFPWRFVTIGHDQRDLFAEKLRAAYLREKPDARKQEVESIEAFAREAPTLIVVLSTPIHSSHIPLWEQELSAGAVCMNLLSAAHALGFVASWLTGWAAYSEEVRDLFGGPGARIAGYIFIGTSSQPLSERPRPDLDLVASRWNPPAA
jgi:nitroreductase